jgi:RNA-binding protein YhbY
MPSQPAAPNSRERAHLRGLGQTLAVSLTVGHEGVTPAVVATLEAQLRKVALVKARFAADRPQRGEQMDALAAACGASCVGTVGRTALFHRPLPADAAGQSD